MISPCPVRDFRSLPKSSACSVPSDRPETGRESDPDIRINAVCVRVPVLRAHSEAINIQFKRDVSPEEAYEVLGSAAGCEVFEDRAANRWAMPLDASGKNPVLVGRLRRDLSQLNTLDMWVVGDQILKGAALNAVQIAELLV